MAIWPVCTPTRDLERDFSYSVSCSVFEFGKVAYEVPIWAAPLLTRSVALIEDV